MTNAMPSTAPATGRRSRLRAALSVLRLVAINFLIFAVLAEIVSIVFLRLKNWPSSGPTYRVNYNMFWADINPAFGVWHRPNGHFFHQMGCFSVEYTTNSYGARDVERSLHSSEPRTVMLGDSFIEGFGLPDQERLSNILERDTGREHLKMDFRFAASCMSRTTRSKCSGPQGSAILEGSNGFDRPGRATRF
jgi:hypothetical protein